MQKKVLSAKEAIAIIQRTIQNIVGPVPLIRTFGYFSVVLSMAAVA
jgi:hypothetical protein